MKFWFFRKFNRELIINKYLNTNDFNHKSSFTPDANATYSASIVESATMLCLWLAYVIGPFTNGKI